MPDVSEVSRQLRAAGQEHLLRFYEELSPGERASLLEQVAALDLGTIPTLVERYVHRKPELHLPSDVGPAPYYPRNPRSPSRPWDEAKARAAGESLIRAGKVAAFTVAGGQGTRLGFDHPKGCFPAGAVTGRTLFQFFADGLLGAMHRYGSTIPWYIMTSPLNHEETVAFFREHGHFGLAASDVRFFPQGTLPSFDIRTGRILLASKSQIATNPDGHGGSITALHASGSLADMKARGVEHISYFQVDNPITRVIDPVFIGLHAGAQDSSGEMSSKMVVKAYPEEKLGVFCTTGGKLDVIEYSDMPRELANARRPDGSLKFDAGSIAIHVLSVRFVERLATDPSFSLPYHRAEKKVECIDPETGRPIAPDAPNAVKLERFVFDALPRCRASILYEADRIEEFAPIKNLTGADSVESSHQIQTERAARWIEAAGGHVPRRTDGKPDCVIELSPRAAAEPDDLREIAPGLRIATGQKVALWEPA
jgi:UDP-N-acetylglucosamine/UDP-N-acetylgalactosamine diphosphorylase